MNETSFELQTHLELYFLLYWTLEIPTQQNSLFSPNLEILCYFPLKIPVWNLPLPLFQFPGFSLAITQTQQSTHRCLYTTSAHHWDPHTTQEQISVELLWAVSERFTGVSTRPHFAVHLQQQQTGVAVPHFVYPMHFTHYFLQWHLRNLGSSNFHFLLNYSKDDEQEPITHGPFEYYPYIYL